MIWKDAVKAIQFYSIAVRSVAGHTTAELQIRGKPGFRSKMHAVDCVLWSFVSLAPVRAIGAVFFFRGTKLCPAERAIYLGYRRRSDCSLACGERYNAEIARQRAAWLDDNPEFWHSLQALTDIVDLNSPSAGDRFV